MQINCTLSRHLKIYPFHFVISCHGNAAASNRTWKKWRSIVLNQTRERVAHCAHMQSTPRRANVTKWGALRHSSCCGSESSLISCLRLQPVADAGRGGSARHAVPTVIPTDSAALINFLPFVCQGNKEPFKKSCASSSSSSVAWRKPWLYADDQVAVPCTGTSAGVSKSDVPVPLINDSWDSHSYTCTEQYKRLIGILFPLSKGGQTLVIKLQFLQGIK